MRITTLSRRRSTSARRRLLSVALVASLLAVLIPTRFAPVIPTAQAASTTVVISQFQVAGGTAADEFVELHNVGSTDFNLNGHRLVYRSAAGTTDVTITTWTTNVIIPAGGYYLVAHTAYDGTPPADRTFNLGATGSFAAGGGGFAIRQGAADTGTIIDSVGYGTATNAFVEGTVEPAPASNASAARLNNGCQDTDNNANDFATVNPATPRSSATTAVLCGAPPPPPSPSLSINDVSQAEGSGGGTTAFTFTVTMTPANTTQTVTVNYATADGTTSPATGGATCGAGVDYITTNGTLTFAPNDTSEQLTVQVCADTTGESNETFFVNLSGASNATIGDAQGLGTIQNDDVTLLLISEVQGSTPSGNAPSPRAGQTVSVRGIVTLLKSNGFFLQEEVSDNDSDPNTSEGIFVFTTAAPTVGVGDQATVTGSVVEFNGLTEISTTNANVSVNNTGNGLPTAVTLTTADLPATGPNAHYTQPLLEKYEGMRVTAASLTTTAPNDNFFDVYTVITGQPRPLREPGIEANKPVPPDPTTGTPDPNVPRFDLNPERLVVDTNGRAGSTGETLTSLVVITNVAGPLDYAFGAYRLVNEAPLNRSANMSAVPVPTPSANEFTVAGYNIENFNNNATQRAKAAQTICDVIRQPDIIGVVEIFDLADLQALAAEVQTRCGVTYSAHLIEANGQSEDNDQDVGYLVKTSRVAVDSVTQERQSETYVPPGSSNPAILHDRPPLVLRARVDPSGVNLPVITIVNHTRSFICIDADVDPAVAANCSGGAADGPRVREKRKKQAESLAGLFQELQTNNPSASIIAVGDYNAFQFNNGYDDPISVMKGNPTPDDQIVVDQSPDLVNPDFYNLIDDLPASEQYTFNFENTLQALDHHLVNTVARARNTRTAIGHVNADFPEVPAAAFASNASRPERNSDHDAVVSYYSLATAQAPSAALVISEFTPRGPLGALDEFVEVFNNTDSPVTVATTDGSAGYGIAAEDGVLRCTIPNGTVIPSRGHFLCAGAQYVYINDVFPDAFVVGGSPTFGDIGDSQGVALFNTSNPANFAAGTRLDAFGYTSSAPLYREGSGYPFVVVANAPRAYVRTQYNAYEQDTGDNGADFISVNSRLDVCCDPYSVLGMAGPQNLASPINRGAATPMSLFDPGASSTAPANRERSATVVPNGQFGTLRFRRTITNNTGQTVTRMRIRVTDISTLQSPTFPAPGKATACAAPCADLRVLSSSDEASIATTSGPKPTSGTTLELAAYQPIGGGYNSSLNVNQVTNMAPVAPGGTINVNILLGVQEKGNARFFVTVEVLP